MIYVKDSDFTLLNCDVQEGLRSLPDESVHCVVTSPPYWGLRDYGTGVWEGGDPDCDHQPKKYEGDRAGRAAVTSTLGGGKAGVGNVREAVATYREVCARCGARRIDNQLGLEPTPDAYITRMVEVFRQVRRVLRRDGTLWLNIGDSYASAWSMPSDRRNLVGQGGLASGKREDRPDRLVGGLKEKDLVGIPWKLALALQQPYYTGTIREERNRLWLAAMIDTEGCIDINRLRVTETTTRRQESFGTYVRVHNTSEVLVRRCAEIAGVGSVKMHDDRRRPVYVWAAYGEKAREVLREVYPHLVAKKHEARLACSPDDESCSALRLLHKGSETPVDRPTPESMFEPGWYLRADIIWAKPNPMPESVTDRPTKSHEYVFLLTRSPRYFFDQEAVREDLKPESIERYAAGYNASWKRAQIASVTDERVDGFHGTPEMLGGGRNVRSVWEIATQAFPDAHFATYPEELVRRCILAGTSERGCCPECGAPWQREVETNNPSKHAADEDARGWANTHSKTSNAQSSKSLHRNKGGVYSTAKVLGWRPGCDCQAAMLASLSGDTDGLPTDPCTVLDPFAGSGTTNFVARKHGRRSIGIELNPAYCALAARRMQQQSLFTEIGT